MHGLRGSPEVPGGGPVSESTAEHPRRRGADTFSGQFKALWPVITAFCSIIMACCLTYAAWDGLKTKSAEHTMRIEKVEGDVDILKQTMAAQTAILGRVESALGNIDRGLRRRYRDDAP